MADPQSFTGRRRRRKTRTSVMVADWTARGLISAGGVGTIIAVLGVCAFLIWVTADLFSPAEVSEPQALAPSWESEPPLHLAVDDYRVIGWSLFPDGRLELFRADNGERLETKRLIDEGEITAISVGGEIADNLVTFKEVALGLSTGKVVLGEIRFDTVFRNPEDVEQERGQLESAIQEARERVAQLQESIENGVAPPDGEPPLEEQLKEPQSKLTENQKELAELDTLRDLKHGQPQPFRGGMVELTTQEQFRIRTLDVALDEPLEVADSFIAAIDCRVERGDLGRTAADVGVIDADGKAFIQTYEISALTDEFEEGKKYEIAHQRSTAPRHIKIADRSDKTYLVWEDGHLMRYDTRGRFRNIQLAEQMDLTDGDAKITAVQFLLGRTTLVVGDSTGRVVGGFPARLGEESRKKSQSPDGTEFIVAHELPGREAPVTALGVSSRNRNVVIGYADGYIRVYYMTIHNLLAEAEIVAGRPVAAAGFAPKEDGLVAAAGGQLWKADFDARYPEITLASVFGAVHYEGYQRPMTMWQSGGSTEESEAKLSLWPLVYGTLKATFYSLLFGAPLALLAAIYTSEFLHPRVRAKIKPTIEVMASLPSVVLGFLAALVIAPVVEKVLPGTLACFLMIPLALLVGAHLWQLLAQDVALRFTRWKFPLMLLCLPLGVFAGLLLGPHLERWMFAGDIKLWLFGERDGQPLGDSVGAWMFLFLPLCALAVLIFSGRIVTPWLRKKFGHVERSTFAELSFVKFLAGIVLTVGLAWALSKGFDSAGFDLRRPNFNSEDSPYVGNASFIGKYDSRNALIVGFFMGFAIIPIIYTISEDALSTVPDHLRSASLAAGATPWQTVVRIVIPTAMSGLFSALMIGLGRAVGETMIVLMATGSTPIKEWNIFNGFRTLSANIAIELPEAPQGETHYRVLFLCGLTLFAMTFVINTIAEIVRLRFRRRAYQL